MFDESGMAMGRSRERWARCGRGRRRSGGCASQPTWCWPCVHALHKTESHRSATGTWFIGARLASVNFEGGLGRLSRFGHGSVLGKCPQALRGPRRRPGGAGPRCLPGLAVGSPRPAAAAAYIGLSRATLYRLERVGDLPANGVPFASPFAPGELRPPGPVLAVRHKQRRL
jgi:hypothetical protein